MDKNTINRWYQQECTNAGLEEASTQTPLYKKILAFTLMLALPTTMTACANNDMTAQSECQWEMEKNGMEYDCDDDSGSSSWYRTHGYSSKKSTVSSNSSYYKAKGFGSAGKSSGGSWSGG